MTSLATIAKKVMSEAAAEAEAVEWRGALVSCRGHRRSGSGDRPGVRQGPQRGGDVNT